MQSFIDIQKRLLPDLLIVLQKRYSILRYIGFMQPVGRRSLAVSLGLTERILRSEVDFLKEQNLIYANSVGMSLTSEGKNLLEDLEGLMRELKGIDVMELELKHRLGIKGVIIVPGDSDESPLVKGELGKASAACMKKLLTGENIIAVTGGSTMAAIAERLTPELTRKNLLFVPARGGVGEDVANQANTICSNMAKNTDSKHRVFYVPDQVSSEIYQSLIKEPEIHEVLKLIKSASMVLHGIGDAITMAERRKTTPKIQQKLETGNAVGEAFGYYFNEEGEIVHKVLTIGLQREDLAGIPNIIAVAGGSSKAKAIKAYLKQAPAATILITDEGAAKRLLKG
ncbi:sugar-binding transcriptional regulator [Neobacillus vireti]|uniref:DeoR family transcriptional regulator n=1 Tax=Neobacillus vireti LMG 21834 TaxID=1131730 RepID=A0AB94ILS6_9BACI|nr:sugar-binding domain-containing protein [Neobacillus vireti]ETI68005.1 DeoR family transcriptional regulator [Neobacillus vireti LMG 21834]KLT18355.1 central glycolytic genes regulator [Neobacillus vireti]